MSDHSIFIFLSEVFAEKTIHPEIVITPPLMGGFFSTGAPNTTFFLSQRA
jgi:hypothetical protein